MDRSKENKLKKILIATKNKIKSLGWFWGTMVFIISGIIFFIPSIILVALFWIFNNEWFLAAATGYITWIVLPTGSWILYLFILSGVLPITIWIKGKIKKKEGDRGEKR